MKVLFAVNREDTSEAITKLYQKQYREIITGKNVYYFNAIIKELQRDPSYDRVVISEDLEPYTNNNFDIIDRFLFEQLDKISDEAISGGGSDIPIIFIASDRRSKSDNLLTKLFSIGVYDALLGNDRSVDEVCKLLNKPRTKKEAKTYYKIESEEVSYQAENEDSVSETEIQNILTHYKKLGKNTERYVDSFNNIAAQYNDAQLRIIARVLPINVKAVLEAESPKYQSVMTFGAGTYEKPEEKEKKKDDLKIGFIETNSNKGRPTKPVVIPSAVNTANVKKLKKKQEEPEPANLIKDNLADDAFADIFGDLDDDDVEEIIEEPVKKGRGRPKKKVAEEEEEKPKRGRGRPKKKVVEDEEQLDISDLQDDDDILPGFEDLDEEENEDNELPGFEDLDEEEDNALPGFNEVEEDTGPGYAELDPEEEKLTRFKEQYSGQSSKYNQVNQSEDDREAYLEKTRHYEITDELARFLSRDRKVVSFVGTTKAGTSFLVNNVADLLAKSGINTAILDVTTNKNSYYIYTKNEEPLRRIALNCLESLEQDIVDGISVSKNLTVFTSVPGKKVEVRDIGKVIETLVKQYSLVIIDCDFDTPNGYFELSQETYLVQSMDILTIQPLTAFLRDLQATNALDPSKLKVVINKAMKIRGLTIKAIIGGISCYNDPEMAYMRNLFDKDRIPSLTVSFDADVLARYLSGMVDCIVSTNGYSKQFLSDLKRLGDMVYPLVNSRGRVDYSKNNKFANNRMEEQNSFSNDMNKTLNRMKKQYK